MAISKILTKSASVIIRNANDGSISALNDIAGKIENIEIQSLKKLAKQSSESNVTVTSLIKTNKDLLSIKMQIRKTKDLLDGAVSSLDGMFTSLDTFCIKTKLENTHITQGAFTRNVIYKTNRNIVSSYILPEKVYYNMSSDVNNYNITRQQYQKFILNLKNFESMIIKHEKSLVLLKSKQNILNEKIDKLK